MKIFVCDAFASKIFNGNQAGLVLLDNNENFPDENLMKNIASELKHSETAFVKRLDDKKFKIRYFTPSEEVELCGHATIATFSCLRDLKEIKIGTYIAETLAGNLEIIVDEKFIWMDMALPTTEYIFNDDEMKEIYNSINLTMEDKAQNLIPKIVKCGLRDIIIPIKCKKTLDDIMMNKEKVIEISKKYNTLSYHLFCLDEEKKVTAYCRDLAPVVAIDEECATGTANAALTHYLKEYSLIDDKSQNTFIQGEAMGKASVILSRYKEDKETIQIGGNAVICFECKFWK